MVPRFLDALAGVVQHACHAERYVTFFAFDDDVDQPTVDVISPTEAGCASRLFDLQICCGLLAVACALNFILNVLPLVE
jgi:hypothetical protein